MRKRAVMEFHRSASQQSLPSRSCQSTELEQWQLLMRPRSKSRSPQAAAADIRLKERSCFLGVGEPRARVLHTSRRRSHRASAALAQHRCAAGEPLICPFLLRRAAVRAAVAAAEFAQHAASCGRFLPLPMPLPLELPDLRGVRLVTTYEQAPPTADVSSGSRRVQLPRLDVTGLPDPPAAAVILHAAFHCQQLRQASQGGEQLRRCLLLPSPPAHSVPRGHWPLPLQDGRGGLHHCGQHAVSGRVDYGMSVCQDGWSGAEDEGLQDNEYDKDASCVIIWTPPYRAVAYQRNAVEIAHMC